MAETATIARPYAEAAFALAKEADALGPWSQAMHAFAEVVAVDTVRAALADPRVDDAAKSDLITVLVEKAAPLPEGFANFVRLLVENDRVAVVGSIVEQFEAKRLAFEGRLHAVVTSAFELTDAQQKQIQSDLEAHYGKPVEIEVRVDPELIGGVKIAVGDDVIDASVRSKLAKMAAALKI